MSTEAQLAEGLIVSMGDDDEEAQVEEQDAVCRVCEEPWAACRLEEHSELCAVMHHFGQDLLDDANLLMLANTIEGQSGGWLRGDGEGGEDGAEVDYTVLRLAWLARNAAALQPDSKAVSSQRAAKKAAGLKALIDLSVSAAMSTLALTYARRILRLVESKLEMLLDASFQFASPLPPRQQPHEVNNNASSPPSPRDFLRRGIAASLRLQVTIEDFDLVKPISRGAYGRVYLARKRATGDYYAIKVMKKKDLVDRDMVLSINNERKILALTNNPFVVRFFYSFTSKHNLYIVMEYLPGGDLSSLLQEVGTLEEDAARQYVAEAVLALEYCHNQCIIHRDLKPDNMLLSAQGHLKLTDFGMSCIGVIEDEAELLRRAIKTMRRSEIGTGGGVGIGVTSADSNSFAG
ncbi:hypothetical protein FOA52_007343 [Chlamydomonas sp. UWO 241]|nr:hypothetical protein FOA52_007343 [Chlamydomonas sp. UWO 241]